MAAAVEAAGPMARMASYERQAVLQHCVDRFKERFDEMAYALCVEAGKPINDAEGEVTRLIDTFRIAAEESRSEEHTSELQSLMRISYAVFCLKKKNKQTVNIKIGENK